MKQSLNSVFVISGIIKVEASVITLGEAFIIPDITKTDFNYCSIVHCFMD